MIDEGSGQPTPTETDTDHARQKKQARHLQLDYRVGKAKPFWRTWIEIADGDVELLNAILAEKQKWEKGERWRWPPYSFDFARIASKVDALKRGEKANVETVSSNAKTASTNALRLPTLDQLQFRADRDEVEVWHAWEAVIALYKDGDEGPQIAKAFKSEKLKWANNQPWRWPYAEWGMVESYARWLKANRVVEFSKPNGRGRT